MYKMLKKPCLRFLQRILKYLDELSSSNLKLIHRENQLSVDPLTGGCIGQDVVSLHCLAPKPFACLVDRKAQI